MDPSESQVALMVLSVLGEKMMARASQATYIGEPPRYASQNVKH